MSIVVNSMPVGRSSAVGPCLGAAAWPAGKIRQSPVRRPAIWLRLAAMRGGCAFHRWGETAGRDGRAHRVRAWAIAARTRTPRNDPIRGGRPGTSGRKACAATDASGGAMDCEARLPSNDPMGGQRAGRSAAGRSRGWRGGAGGADVSRSACAAQRPYMRRPTRLVRGWWPTKFGCRATTLYVGDWPGAARLAGQWRGGRVAERRRRATTL